MELCLDVGCKCKTITDRKLGSFLLRSIWLASCACHKVQKPRMGGHGCGGKWTRVKIDGWLWAADSAPLEPAPAAPQPAPEPALPVVPAAAKVMKKGKKKVMKKAKENSGQQK